MKQNKNLDNTARSGQPVDERDYWLHTLSGDLVKNSFPYDFKAIDGSEPVTRSIEFRFDLETASKLLSITNKSDIRLHMLLVAGIVLLTSKYTGSSDIIIGAPIYKQEKKADFINTVLVLRNRLQADMTFKELIFRVKQCIAGAVEHQNYPLKTLFYELDIPFNPEDFQLFDTAVLLENIHDESYIKHIRTNTLFSFFRDGETITGKLAFNALLFKNETMEKISHCLQNLLKDALYNVDSRLEAFDMLTPEEKQKVLFDFNPSSVGDTFKGTGTDTIHELFEQQVEKKPGNIAAVGDEIEYSYGQLNAKADSLARELTERGVAPGSIVGIMIHTPLNLTTGIIGILKSGAAYLPIDPAYPEERINYIFADSGLEVLVHDCPGHPEGLDHVNIFLNLNNQGITAGKGNAAPVRVQPGDAAYVIYTSGTTGRPKGVVMEHHGAVNTLLYRRDEYKIDSSVTALQLFSFAFDGFVTSFFTPLISGAKIVMLGKEKIKDIARVKDLIITHRVTHFISVPILYRYIIEAMSPDETSSIKVVTLAGDTVTPEIIGITRQKNRNLEIAQEYGVTEAAVMSTVFRHQEQDEQMKIGHPIANTGIYILDQYHQPQPIGVWGEMYLAGAGVAREYLGKPELTAQKFLPDPFADGGRMYKSGDIGRWLPDGNIEFKGREDYQVKIRGFRIELAEIENQLRSFPPVADAIVIQKEVNAGDKHLVAFAVPDPHHAPLVGRQLSLEKEGIARQHLKHQLPDGTPLYCLNRNEADLVYRENIDAIGQMKDNILLTEGACIVDVGANIGMLSIILSRLSRQVTVYAIEPVADICKVLQLNASLHAVDTHIIQAGLSSDEGEFDYTYYPNASILSSRFADTPNDTKLVETFLLDQPEPAGKKTLSGEMVAELLEQSLAHHTCTCSTTTLSSVIKRHDLDTIDLLKIDVGKSESDVLAGIGNEDWHKIRQLMIEVHHTDENKSLDHVRELLLAKGYNVNIELERQVDQLGIYHLYAVQEGIEPTDPGNILTGQDAAIDNPGIWNTITLVEGLQQHAREHLPDYMVPGIFQLLPRFPLTPNGKIDRETLRDLELSNVKGSLVAPANKIEHELQEIWSHVLGIAKEKISTDADFFDIGGHSLKATILVSNIHKVLDVKVPLTAIFEYPDIKRLARFIENHAEDTFVSIETAAPRDYYPLSPGQQRLYLQQQLDPGGIGFNIPHVFWILGEIQTQKLEDTFTALIRRHEILRTSFTVKDDQPIQVIHDNVPFRVKFYENQDIEEIKKGFIQPFDLSNVPAMRVGLVRVNPGKHLFMLDMHHIITDGTSMGIFISDFIALYTGRRLAPLKIQFKDFSQWQLGEMEKESYKKQEQYWFKEFEDRIPQLQLPTDFPRPEMSRFRGDRVTSTINSDLTTVLQELTQKHNITLFMALLAGYFILVSKYSRQSDIVVGSSVSGRRNIDLKSVMGVFFNMLALRSKPRGEKSFGGYLEEVKATVLNAMENQDYPFDHLAMKLGLTGRENRRPLFNISFAMQNFEMAEISSDVLNIQACPFEYDISRYDLSLFAIEDDDVIRLVMEYSTELFKKPKIVKMLEHYREILTQVTRNPDIQLKDIKLTHHLIAASSKRGNAQPAFDF